MDCYVRKLKEMVEIAMEVEKEKEKELANMQALLPDPVQKLSSSHRFIQTHENNPQKYLGTAYLFFSNLHSLHS